MSRWRRRYHARHRRHRRLVMDRLCDRIVSALSEEMSPKWARICVYGPRAGSEAEQAELGYFTAYLANKVDEILRSAYCVPYRERAPAGSIEERFYLEIGKAMGLTPRES